ncbi:MAG: hypothetical protein ABW221_10715 [Vicinamibacteria bacterium]
MSRPTISVLAALGCLGACASPAVPTAGPPPATVAPAPAAPRAYLYVLSTAGGAWSLRHRAVGADGRLGAESPDDPLPIDGDVVGLLADGPRARLHVIGAGTPSPLVTFTADHATGDLDVSATAALLDEITTAALAPRGDVLYGAIRRTQQIDAYRLSPDAAPTRLAGAPFEKDSVYRTLRGLAVAPSGRVLLAHGFLAYKSHGLITFSVDAAGALAQQDQVALYDAGSNIGISADERFVFISQPRDWRAFTLFPDGLLQEAAHSPAPAPLSYWIASGPSRHWMIGAGGGEVSALAVEDGVPRVHEAAAAVSIGYPRFAASRGGFVYVAGDDAVAVLRMDEIRGTLELVQEERAPERRTVRFAALVEIPAP